LTAIAFRFCCTILARLCGFALPAGDHEFVQEWIFTSPSEAKCERVQADRGGPPASHTAEIAEAKRCAWSGWTVFAFSQPVRITMIFNYHPSDRDDAALKSIVFLLFLFFSRGARFQPVF